jgi:hypothetical protein
MIFTTNGEKTTNARTFATMKINPRLIFTRNGKKSPNARTFATMQINAGLIFTKNGENRRRVPVCAMKIKSRERVAMAVGLAGGVSAGQSSAAPQTN